MSCQKAEATGLWRCGREPGHPGAHLSREALEQVRLLILKFEQRLFVLKGKDLGAARRQIQRFRRALNG